jgi:wobble nucleotide-excising tRNase
MIHKIQRLVSVGKFRDYSPFGDVCFRKLTLIYGDNGSGKTTLTNVIRSFAQNAPNLIKRRRSTNSGQPQVAQFTTRTAQGDITHTYRDEGWSNHFSQIEIFDSHFVNENVYSGFDFTDDHKKKLHQFVIGAQGVVLQTEIEDNKTAKSTARQNIVTLEQQIVEACDNLLVPTGMASFISITQNQFENIDQRIAAAEQVLSNANAYAYIQNYQSPTALPEINVIIDYNVISADLQATTNQIANEALKHRFVIHRDDLISHGITTAENWIKSGIDYISTKLKNNDTLPASCPFCKQPISADFDIIKAYTEHFNDAFNAHLRRLQDHQSSLNRINIDFDKQLLLGSIDLNASHVQQWRNHLPAAIAPQTLDISACFAEIQGNFDLLVNSVQIKIANPTSSVDNSSIQNLQLSLAELNNRIRTYNQKVQAYNAAITTFRSRITSVAQAQNDLNRLKLIKHRFTPGVMTLCDNVVQETRLLKTLETTYTDISRRQQAIAVSFFQTYKEHINHYLRDVFRTPFLVQELTHVPPQGRATQSKIGYKLTIDGNDISFNEDQPNCVKDCLSEGDKSTIALAFFLSKADIDSGKVNKIFLFDDPLSSFDSNRRHYTIELLKSLLQQVKQIVVLSHNEIFLYELSKELPVGDKKALRITENLLTGSSSLEPIELDSLVEPDYFKHIKELEAFLLRADIAQKEHILGLMRNVLESHIRFKFYRQTRQIPAANRTFGTLITTLCNANVAFRDNQHRASVIDKLRMINALSCRPHHGEPLPDYAAIGVNPDTISVRELGNYVQDTIDLIDNKL